MGNHDRDRWGFDREPERWRDRNRGMFGYEGEGYMGGEGDRDRFSHDRADMPDRVSGGRDPERYGSRDFAPYSGRELERYTGRDRADEKDRWTRDHELPSSYRGLGPRGYRRTDERLHEEVCERLAWDHDVDARDIEVAVADGTVTLTGTVASRRMKKVAEHLAESVSGVHDVQNHLSIRSLDREYGRHGEDEPLQSGVLGLTTTENMDEPRDRAGGIGGARPRPGGEGFSRTGTMNTPAADSTPITNPGAPATGMGTSANSGIVSGHTSAGDRARRKR